MLPRVLTVSAGRLQRGRLSDGPGPPLRLLEVGERVLDQRDPKALLHPLPGHSGAHPAPPERVEIGCEVGADVRAARAPVRPAARAVRQVESHRGPAGRRADPPDGQGAPRQAHRVPDPVVERVRELPVQQRARRPVPLAGRVRSRGVCLHPGAESAARPAGRCADGGAVRRGAARCRLRSWQPAVGPCECELSSSACPESLPSDRKGERQGWSLPDRHRLLKPDNIQYLLLQTI